jgi:hypothetical protein
MTSKISKIATIVNPITKFKIISNNPADPGGKPVEEQLLIGKAA